MTVVSLLVWEIRGFMQGNTSLTDESPEVRRLDLARPALVGRLQDADVYLENGERTVARQHARLSLRGFGVAWEDLGSSNGVRLIDVDGREFPHAATGVAAPGTRLRLGAFVIGVDRVPEPRLTDEARATLRAARGRPAYLAVYADQLESHGELDVANWLRSDLNGRRASLRQVPSNLRAAATQAPVVGGCAGDWADLPDVDDFSRRCRCGKAVRFARSQMEARAFAAGGHYVVDPVATPR